jgi:hypothetical protein
MPTPSSLLSRLLLAAAPAVAVGCDSLGPRVSLQEPPLRPSRAVPSASSVAAQPGDHALGVCGTEYLHRPIGRTGGPYAGAHCYQPVAPATGCLAPTDPALPRALDVTHAQCVHNGPHAQSDPASGAPWCCYNLGFMGEGRPLVLDGARRAAGLTARGAWA